MNKFNDFTILVIFNGGYAILFYCAIHILKGGW